MAYELPKLPYAYDALEPHIDARTMEIHHTKHHQAYITNVNNALKDKPELAAKSIEDLISRSERGAGRHSHRRAQQRRRSRESFLLLENHGTEGRRRTIRQTCRRHQVHLRQLRRFQGEISAMRASKRFGSGWAWLIKNKSGKLEIISTPNQDSPLMDGNTPILGVDVWEHAYYLNYQNRRPDYLKAWWNVVNWDEVAKNY